jgi:hypothetical protein
VVGSRRCSSMLYTYPHTWWIVGERFRGTRFYGGAIKKGAETKGADLTIALDDDRREERENAVQV